MFKTSTESSVHRIVFFDNYGHEFYQDPLTNFQKIVTLECQCAYIEGRVENLDKEMRKTDKMIQRIQKNLEGLGATLAFYQNLISHNIAKKREPFFSLSRTFVKKQKLI
jgi:uncharacterized coiled-coil protein SlyX